MRRRGLLEPHEAKITVVQQVADGASIVLAHVVATHVVGEAWTERSTLATVLAVVVFMVIAELGSLYRPWRTLPLLREIGTALSSWIVTVPVLLFVAFASKTSAQYSRLITSLWFLLVPFGLAAWRGALRVALAELRRRGRNTRTVAIVGATEVGVRLAVAVLEQPWTGLRLVGFYDDRDRTRRIAVPEVVGEVRGDLSELVARAHAGDVNLVYVALPLRAERRVRALLRELADTTASVYVVADFFAYDLLRAEWTTMGDIPLVSVVETPFYGVDGWLKRIEDVALGSIILAMIALPMAVIAAAIKLTSKGPVFFRQRRYGLNGAPIEVLKFRTMKVCEDGPVVRQATKNDPRVTPLGAVLRRTSLDELPQFFHVITGKMSIVGPRPHAVAHNEAYRHMVPSYMLRHKVKPGITGWAQVNGWRGETDTVEKMEQRVVHDLDYIRRWSLGWDLKIILMTVFGSSAHKNAY